MAESDRERLREQALALPEAHASDFVKARPPDDADPSHLRRIKDTSLRTKLVEVGLAQGLQSPKGPQKIASIVRIYPDFDAPGRTSPARNASRALRANGRTAPPPATQLADRRLPSVDEMEALVARIRAVEGEIEADLSARVDERIDRLKSDLAALSGDELEAAYADLGQALGEKRALRSQIRFETFARIERDGDFAPRAYLRFLRR